MPQLDKFTYFTPIFITIFNVLAGIMNIIWFPGEVAAPLIIVGGASAIFCLFSAKSDEERSLSLLSVVINNAMIFFVVQMPDPCSFLVGLFLVLLASFHIFIFFSTEICFHFLIFSVLLGRIFFHHQMGQWGFGLVTELIFLRLFLKKAYRSLEASRIDPVFYLIPLFVIALFNLVYLDYGLKEILIHMNFIFAASALIFRTFFVETLDSLKVAFFFYVIANLSIGFFISESVNSFFTVTSIFLISLGLFWSFFYLKAQRSDQPVSSVLLAHNKEGFKTILVIYFMVLGPLITQLHPGTVALSLYLNWIMGLGIQIGFLTILDYFFQKLSCLSLPHRSKSHSFSASSSYG